MNTENSALPNQPSHTYVNKTEPLSPQQLGKKFSVTRTDDSREALDVMRLKNAITWASKGVEKFVNPNLVVEETIRNIFDGISVEELSEALVLASVAFIEKDPAYGQVAAQLMLRKMFIAVSGTSITEENFEATYRSSFVSSIVKGVEYGIIDKRMLDFDLEALSKALVLDRDHLFDYMGIKTLYERYFTRYEGHYLELPQSFWMRVSMGLALNEKNRTEKTLEFYNLISQLDYIPSTPTLLHSGLTRPQLSSCFLTTVEDDLHHIFKCYGDNAQLSKWSGGVANDWTNVRATGAMVDTIKTESQGSIPFLKIANDVTAAINRSGKRRGATVVYLETWHLDIEDFLDLRRNTGDERRRTHDINTANWVPDLFMKRVATDEQWTLFSPHEVPELHHLYGKAFEEKYVEYEKQAQQGKLKQYSVVSATKLWRKMLSRLFETGHPWITFKDPANVRSPQDHVGVVHSSNLCTEITLNTSAEETAVCNLGSVNLSRHVVDGKLDQDKIAKTVTTAMRMLDNVVDINFYPTQEAQNANFKHRPVGLGVMGFQDALYKLDIAFDSQQALEFADQMMETISYYAILGSSQLAKEFGAYESFKGSKWDRGIFPNDTLDLLEQERGVKIECKRGGKRDWSLVKEHVKKYGMRNSNTMAIAPTATISNIAGAFPCIEPIYKNIYVKANMSGEFTVVNKYLVEDLKELGLWDEHMLDQLKYFDGNLQMIVEIPQHLKDKYKEAFEIDPEWCIKLTASRGKWIDQSQSHNVFMNGVSGKKLNDIYFAAWNAGLKSTYYLRTLGASQIEKSTLDAKKYGFTQKREYKEVANGSVNGVQEAAAQEKPVDVQEVNMAPVNLTETKMSCTLSDDPSCESCQ